MVVSGRQFRKRGFSRLLSFVSVLKALIFTNIVFWNRKKFVNSVILSEFSSKQEIS